MFQADEKDIRPERPASASFWQAYLFGLAMKIGSLTTTWHYGLTVGIYEYFIAFLIIASAYLMLCLCMAEMVSIMSFTGGYYGYARCALGPFAGFLVGCSGAWESIFYLSLLILKLGQTSSYVYGLNQGQQIIVWFVSYCGLICFHVCIGRFFWVSIRILVTLTLILLAIYLFGSMNQMNFHKYALQESNGFQQSNNYQEFLNVLRLSMVLFLGFDMITITSSEVINARKVIPRVLLALFVTLFILAVWLIFTAVSQEPGIVKTFYKRSTIFPYSFGFAHLFHISLPHATLIVAIFPAVSALGYLHIVSKQIKYMSLSGLLPLFLSKTIGSEETPLNAMILAAIIAFAGNYFALREGVNIVTSRIATIAGCFVYLTMFYCYLVFKIRFGHLDRSFVNPLGIFGAIYGFLVILTVLFSVLYFKQRDYYPVTCFYFSYMTAMLCYYYLWVETHQFFSIHEQKVFFKAYILNMHLRKRKSVKRRIAYDITSIFRNILRIFSFKHSSDSQKAVSLENKDIDPIKQQVILDDPLTDTNNQRTTSTRNYTKIESFLEIASVSSHSKTVVLAQTTNKQNKEMINLEETEDNELDKPIKTTRNLVI